MFYEIFLKSPVSSIVLKNIKRALWGFLNIHSFAKQKKKKGEPFEDNKKIAKISHKAKIPYKKISVKGLTRTYVLLLGRPQKSQLTSKLNLY